MSGAPTQHEAVTGVQLAQGIGHQPAKGFWADAWTQVIQRPAALFGIGWIGVVAFFSITAPLVASGHPWVLKGADGSVTSPLIRALKASDVAILAWAAAGVAVMLLARAMPKGDRLRLAVALGVQAGLTVVLATAVGSMVSGREVAPWIRDLRASSVFVPLTAGLIALLSAVPFLVISVWAYRSWVRSALVVVAAVMLGLIVSWKWTPPLYTFQYRAMESTGDVRAVYTVVPFSPNQSQTIMFNRPPGSTPMNAWWDLVERDLLAQGGRRAVYSEAELAAIPVTEETIDSVRRAGDAVRGLVSTAPAALADQVATEVETGRVTNLLELRNYLTGLPAPIHHMGTDTLGQDVLSQMLHASRLSISIGFVSTGIAVLIGVTIGALMGYFGGWVDLLLYRLVEIFMAVPVLFVLIVAAGVLPRNIYFMMAIIGCFTWTGAARFIRAEFMKLRNADYVQAARAAGLPLRSILFRHMLPNGVTPVLVDTSFTIAAAIIIEAILSFLGLGPADQASWGKLLSNAVGDAGGYMWWLAIFPGAAIFLTALSYNLIGEALRDAIDPKLKKARV